MPARPPVLRLVRRSAARCQPLLLVPNSDSAGAMIRWRARLPSFVRLSSEPARDAVRQNCSFSNEQRSPRALLGVVLSRALNSSPGARLLSHDGATTVATGVAHLARLQDSASAVT
jgi:hypothetical protein